MRSLFLVSFENEQSILRSNELDKNLEIKVTCLGPILEGHGAISSDLKEAEYEAFGDKLRQSISEIEEKNCTACKDGRKCLHHSDGSEYKVRPRVAGASATPLAMMGMGDRNFSEGLRDIAETASDIYQAAEDLSVHVGNEESAHTDCGAIKGLAKHARAVSQAKDSSPNVAFVKTYLEAEVKDQDAQSLIDNARQLAGQFADVLEARHYDGQQYIETVQARNPHGVEELQVEADKPSNGHAEQAVVLVFSDLDEDGRPLYSIDDEKLAELADEAQVFTVNVDELSRQANLLGGTEKQKAQLLTASLLHHLAGVYPSLCDGSHPVYLIHVNGK